MAGSKKNHRLRKTLCVFLSLLALFLVGTVVVLTTVVQYFGVDWRDVITEPEMRRYEQLALQAQQASPPALLVAEPQAAIVAAAAAQPPPPPKTLGEDGAYQVAQAVNDDADDDLDTLGNAAQVDNAADLDKRDAIVARQDLANSTTTPPRPRIPKIIHQTWKTDVLPERWQTVRATCMEMHPEYEYMLWTDAQSREFIAKEYSWFLSTFDGYPYPIQRADAIRYFILHHYGGVYMDLDVGCKRKLDPLLYFQVILPATIPVGVSNDIMFAEKGHPFMDLVIHNLVTFDHQYGTNYPTVMFSTGPMFLSAQYGLWPKEDIALADRQVRILPRRWYGKNAPVLEMEDSFFEHFYGSSWHADDAGFITFLGKFGMILMYIGFSIVVLGLARMLWNKRWFLKGKSQAIALPFQHGSDNGLPYARAGTPSSRPDSPLSRSGTPRARQDGANNNRGVLYYLPVWFMPPSDRGSPSQERGSWTQYLPGVGYDDASDSHYEPVPDFSRPPSPSNNSILHAPGAMHDGAFDGVQLHSIHAPRPHTPRPSSPSAPTSPQPPSYSSLKSWGTQFFRSPRAAILPLVSSATSPPPAESAALHNGHGHQHGGSFIPGHSARTSSTSTLFGHHSAPARPRSPLPQYQPPSNASSSAFGGTAKAGGFTDRKQSTTGRVAESAGGGIVVPPGSSGSSRPTTSPTSASSADADDRRGSVNLNSTEDEERLWEERESSAGESAGGVEEEVDRLLSEMEPDVEAKLALAAREAERRS